MCRKRVNMKTTTSSRSRMRRMFVVSSLVLSVVGVGMTDVVRKNESHVRPLIEVGRIERTL